MSQSSGNTKLKTIKIHIYKSEILITILKRQYLFHLYRWLSVAGTPGCHLDPSLTCWRPVSLLHGPASARGAELQLRALRSAELCTEPIDGSPRLKVISQALKGARRSIRTSKGVQFHR